MLALGRKCSYFCHWQIQRGYASMRNMDSVTGIQLRTWREARQLTQTELARLLGVEHNTVYRWEKGMRSPPAGIVLDLALDGLIARGLVAPDAPTPA
jgi:DNA-binding XRE family transcriptional regulator